MTMMKMTKRRTTKMTSSSSENSNNRDTILVDDPMMPAGYKKRIPKAEFFDGVRKTMIMTQQLLQANEIRKRVQDAEHKARHDATSQQISALNKTLREIDAEAERERDKLRQYEDRLKNDAWEKVAPLVRAVRLAEVRRRLMTPGSFETRKAWNGDYIEVEGYRDNPPTKKPIKTLYTDTLKVMAVYEEYDDSGKPVNKVAYNIKAVYLVQRETQVLINEHFFRVHDSGNGTEYATTHIHNRDFRTQEEAEKYAERNRDKILAPLVERLEKFDKDVMDAYEMDDVFDFRLLFHTVVEPRYSTRENTYKIAEVSSDRVVMRRFEEDRWDDKAQEYRDILYPEMIEVTRDGYTFLVKGAGQAHHVKEIGERMNDFYGVAFDVRDVETGQDANEDEKEEERRRYE